MIFMTDQSQDHFGTGTTPVGMATQAKSRIKSAHGNTLYNGMKQGVKANRPVPHGEDRFSLYHRDTARRPESGCVRDFINIPTIIPDT
jgi:hypothetical protein